MTRNTSMETPFLRLTPKEFLTGIAPSAHTGRGGVFFKADGVTPVYDPGGTASVENGLLQAGPAPTDFTGSVVVDNIIAGVASSFTGAAHLYMLGSSGHFYDKAVGSGTPTDLRSGTQITNPASGLVVWSPAGGTPLCYIWRQNKIDTWNMSGTYPTGWTADVYSITQGNNSTILKPVHKFVGNVYYGNGDLLGAITDAGSGTASHSSNVLDFPTRELITGLADDGRYLVIATTENAAEQSDTFARNYIRFWDTNSTSWTREWPIRDPFIWAVKHLGGGVIHAYGQYGVYEGTFDFGFKKILPRMIGFGTGGDLTSGYGCSRATVYNNDTLLFATDTTIDTLGKPSPDLQSAYLKPFKVPSAVGTPTFVSADLDPGRVYVATDGPKLYGYDFNGSTRDTGVTAQTVYFPVPSKTTVKRVEVVFGEPLASGDSVSVSIYKDEDTAAVSFGTAAYASQGAARRVSMSKSITVDSQLSVLITFTAGAAKIRAIELYGDEMET